MDHEAASRIGWLSAALHRCCRLLLCGLIAAIVTGSPAAAMSRHGPIQISGNLETQQLFRLENNVNQWSGFDPVQQRNTFRFQYEHELIERDRQGNRKFLGMFSIPGVKKASLFGYYRFVYETIYDIAPGESFGPRTGAWPERSATCGLATERCASNSPEARGRPSRWRTSCGRCSSISSSVPCR